MGIWLGTPGAAGMCSDFDAAYRQADSVESTLTSDIICQTGGRTYPSHTTITSGSKNGCLQLTIKSSVS